jgi:AcrR family transcriptional regulator
MGSADDRPKLLHRRERRQSLISAAARAFARGGYVATSLDDVATEAGVSRVLIYRHFESKAELYEAVLVEFRDTLVHATGAPDEMDPTSLEKLVQVAQTHPDEFRLFFRYAATEPQFSEHTEWLRTAMAETAQPYLSEMFQDEALRRWAAGLIPAIVIEAVLSWMDAGCPHPDTAAATIGAAVGSVIDALHSGKAAT